MWPSCLHFPAVTARATPRQEALANVREAILLTIENMRERGEPIPDPSGEIVRRIAVGE
jgi:predicted RNase H-like HicB family nuclease